MSTDIAAPDVDGSGSGSRHEAHAGSPRAKSGTERAVGLLLVVSLLAVVLPYVVLSFFNHPQNDDYLFAALVRKLGYRETFKVFYEHWTPRYFAIVASMVSPAVFRAFFVYKLVSVLTIGLVLSSTFLFVREMTHAAFTGRNAFLAALAITAIFFFKLPAPAETVYWLNGTLCYQYGGILLLSGVALTMRSRRAASRRSAAVLTGAAGLLLFAAGGTNELTLICEVGLFATLAFVEFLRRRSIRKQTLFLLGVTLAAATVVFLSPGMWARHNQLPHSLPKALMATGASTLRNLALWLFATPLLPVLLLVFRSATPITRRILPFRLHPAPALLGSAGLLFLLFFIPVYGAESTEVRVFATIYFVFLVLLFSNVCLLLDHFLDRRSLAAFPRSPRAAMATFVVAVFLFVVPSSSMRTAYADVLSGRAYRFDREMKARYRSIRLCPTRVCEVAPLQNWPSTIKFFDDAFDPRKDDEFYSNYKRGFAEFFGRDLIVSKPR